MISYVDGLLRIAFALLQISIVKKKIKKTQGKHESRERVQELFRELCIITSSLGSSWDRFLLSALPRTGIHDKKRARTGRQPCV